MTEVRPALCAACGRTIDYEANGENAVYVCDHCDQEMCLACFRAHRESATLVQVGWYCAGGHLNDHGEEVGQSFRSDDPCAHGVPMYVRAVECSHMAPCTPTYKCSMHRREC